MKDKTETLGAEATAPSKAETSSNALASNQPAVAASASPRLPAYVMHG